MESLIPVFNKVQDIFTITGTSGLKRLQFPQIVVVGFQSSGKSSVLEGLVGHSFLPKGSGIVTRCPIILQLIHLAADKGGDSCVFLHAPDKTFTDFEEVREEIESETARIAGTNKGITSVPITLKIYSKNVLDLTLDLPGLVKVPVGDQPKDIEKQVKDLVMTYIKNPNSIILAISPATMDIAISESLKYANEVDPEGLRTVVVITKLDCVPEGETAVDVLSGKVLPVKLGIIGVVNRSQQDIADKKPISDKIKEEAVFLARNYPTIASKNGVPYLGKCLNRKLNETICFCLPDVEERIQCLLKENKAILEMWKEDNCEKSEIRLTKIVAEFTKIYCNALVGKSDDVSTEKIAGGALIEAEFEEKLNSDVTKIKPDADVKDETIIYAIINSKGYKQNLFIPEEAFETVVKRQISRLERPALDCAANVAQTLVEIIHDCFANQDFKPYMERYSVLKNSISLVVRGVVAEGLVKGESILKTYVLIKAGHISTNRQGFYDKMKTIMSEGLSDINDSERAKFTKLLGRVCGDYALIKLSKLTFGGIGGAVVTPILESLIDKTRDMAGDSSGENLNKCKQVISAWDQCRIIRQLMNNYFDIVVEDFKDFVPQSLVEFMIKPLSENLHSTLISKLYKDHEKLMKESEAVTSQIKTASEMIEALEKAAQLIFEVRETHF